MENIILYLWEFWLDVEFGLTQLGSVLTGSIVDFLSLGDFVDIPGLPDLADLQQAITAVLTKLGLDVSVLGFLFGTGITTILAFSIIRWFIGWVTGAG